MVSYGKDRMIKYIKYNTGDQLWINHQGQTLYCIADDGKHYDFRIQGLLHQFLPCPYCGNKDHTLEFSNHIPYQSYDVEITDDLDNQSYFYIFDDVIDHHDVFL